DAPDHQPPDRGRRYLRWAQDGDAVVQRLLRALDPPSIDALVVVLPNYRSYFSDHLTSPLLDQLRITMARMGVMVKFVHLRFDPVYAFIPFLNRFLDTASDLCEGEHRLVRQFLWHNQR